MKFYQDFGFKWTAASTLVLASIFAMTSFSANAGAPIANPPGGNISPTFTNLTTATDVIVGKNLRIGDSIMPNSGTSFAIKADKVNFTKDLEAKGNIVSSGGGITAEGGGWVTGWNLKAVSTIMGTYADISQNIKAFGTITGKDVVADGGSISATGGGEIKGWNLKATSTVSGTNASFSQDINAVGKITGANIVSQGNISTTTGTISGKDLAISGHLKTGSVGAFNQMNLLGNNGGNSVLVAPGKVGAVSSVNCAAKYEQMLSCSVFSYQNTLTASTIISSKTGWGQDWNCSVIAKNNGTTNAIYSAQAVCFDPNK